MSGPEEPKQAPPSPYYVPGPEYLAPANDEIVAEDHHYTDYASPIALSPRGDDDDDDDEEEEEALEEEEHLALADYVIAPAVDHVPSFEETEPQLYVERPLALPTPSSPLISLSPPSAEECLARCLATPALPIVPHPYGNPNHMRIPPVFRAAMCRLRASSPSTHHPLHPSPPLPPLPSSLYLPPPVPTSSPLPSSPLPPLPASLFIPPPVGESLTATRLTGGHRADYGFIGIQRAEEVGYGIRDVWVDLTKVVEEIALMTLEGVNATVTEIAQVHEEDTQDIYAVIEDSQDRQTLLSQRVDVLIEDREFHQETMLLMEQEALVSFLQGQLSTTLGQIQALQARDSTHADNPEGADSCSMANNMPPKRTSIAAARVADAAVAPMTAAVVEQLIETRLSAALANHETLRNSINGHGDGSHNSHREIKGTGTEGVVVLSQWFEKMESVFHITNCVVENQVKFATCTFLINAMTWGEIKKLEIELWNLKVKGTDVASYTLRFQELALMCGKMFHEESDEVEKYVGRLPDMIRGNVMCWD
ncbi:hypothetical protein Tco_0322249 [Tanacetum coccineum]